MIWFVAISVAAPPIAVDDSYSTDEDLPIATNGGAGVLKNDSDADGDTLTVSLVDAPLHASLSLNADGGFLFTPDPDFAGSLSFTYTANDGSTDSALATVTIDVLPVNDAPEGQPDDYELDEDQVLRVAAPGVLTNDDDVDGDPLQAELIDDVAHGNLKWRGDGSFTYTPDPDFNGSDSLSYAASDGVSAPGLIDVTLNVLPINDPPTTSDLSAVTRGVTPVTVTLSGEDPDGDELSFEVVPADHGDARVDGNQLTYTAAASFAGSEAVQFSVSDGPAQAQGTVTIEVIDPEQDLKGCGCASGGSGGLFFWWLPLVMAHRRYPRADLGAQSLPPVGRDRPPTTR